MPEEAKQQSNYERALKLIPDEPSAICYFSGLRWQHGRCCPYCGHPKLWNASYSDTYKCAECKRKFSITVGTIFEDIKLPLQKWLLAIAYLTDHPGSASSTALAKLIGVSQKRAWHMMERLRQASLAPTFRTPKRRETVSRKPATDAQKIGPTVGDDKTLPCDIRPGDAKDAEFLLRGLPRRPLNHIADEQRARDYIRSNVYAQGYRLKPRATYNWARRQGFDRPSALDLQEIVAGFEAIERIKEKRKRLAKKQPQQFRGPTILEALKGALRRNFGADAGDEGGR